MDDSDRIIGDFFSDNVDLSILNYPLPPIPMNTNGLLQSVIQQNFPQGSPNITVDAPWVKNVSTCSHEHDSRLTHYFQETEFVWSNDICSLGAGKYTWLITSDLQISFGKYINNYEIGSKHSNIAMKRPGYVGGELLVVSSTLNSKHTIGWNLLSGTYSEPISQSMNETNPYYYLNHVLKSKVNNILQATDCYNNMYYWNSEFFIPVLPSIEYTSWLCANNIFIKNYNSLVWADDNQSVCENWGEGVCL